MKTFLPTFAVSRAAAATGGEWRGAVPAEFHGIFTDTRKPLPGAAFLALRGERFDAHDHLREAVDGGAALLCIERASLAKAPEGIPLLVVDDTLRAYQALASLHRASFASLPLAGVTGSVGKTSVKEMLRAIFTEAAGGDEFVLATEGNTNNQVGVPLNLLRLRPEHRFAVIEMGTNHNGEIEPLSRCAMPRCAIVNSIAPCHLEAFLDLDGVAREKCHIFDGLAADGVAVLPYEVAGSEILRRAAGNRRILRFGTDERAEFRALYRGGAMEESEFTLRFPDGRSFDIRWQLAGAHQALNAAGAAAVASAFGIAPETIASGLRRTRLPGMRNRITRLGGVDYINDAYNANPASMRSAFDYLAGFADPAKLVLVLGGMRELGPGSAAEHRELRLLARRRFPAATIVLIGPEFTDPGAETHFDTSAEAQEFLRAAAKPGFTVFAKGSYGTATWKALPPEAQ